MTASVKAFELLRPPPANEATAPEDRPGILWGQGTPAAIAPFTTVNKGSFYMQVDATDDNTCVWMKVDEGGDTADWVKVFASGMNEAMQIGVFNSTADGYGIPLDEVTTTAAWRVYADDAGAALTPTGSVSDIRASLSRFLITANQATPHVRAWGDMGQVKIYDCTFSEEQVGGVCGRLEVVQSAETVTLGGYGISAGVTGILATAGTVTVDTYHWACGVAAIADIKGTLTCTGNTAGVFVGQYNTSQWSDATTRTQWKYGIYIDEDSVSYCPFAIGEFVASAAAGGGFALTATNSAAMRVYAEVETDLTAAAMVRAIVGRTVCVGATEITQNGELFGVVGQLVTKQATIRHDSAGVLGTFEGQTTHVHIDGTGGDNVAAGVLGRVGISVSSSTVSASGILAGVAAMSNITSGAVTVSSGGILAGLYVGAFSGKQVWDVGLYISTSACTIPIQIGVDADGIPVVIIAGNFADGAASGYGHGSIGMDTTDGLLMYADTSKVWQTIAAA